MMCIQKQCTKIKATGREETRLYRRQPSAFCQLPYSSSSRLSATWKIHPKYQQQDNHQELTQHTKLES
jgi:hypothetical protein